MYVEPFVGGGAVLFWILQKYSNISQAVINDINPDLINVYRVIKDTPQDLISVLRQYQDSYICQNDDEQKRYLDFLDRLYEKKSMVFDCRHLQQQSFVFYTSDGICYSPSMENVENLQILGFESGYNSEDALHKLLLDNDWITDCMYDAATIYSRRLAL